MANSQHIKLQTLHEFKRGRAILERTMIKHPAGSHFFSGRLIQPIHGRCFQIQSPGMHCAMLWMDWPSKRQSNVWRTLTAKETNLMLVVGFVMSCASRFGLVLSSFHIN